jgi:SAM-dependent methyltransferase
MLSLAGTETMMTEITDRATAAAETPPTADDSVGLGSRENDDEADASINENRADGRETYTDVAELYHEFRPRYPESLVDAGIRSSMLLTQKSPNECRILEIGCGPGTLTAPLARRGYQITAIEPGSGMIEKARQVCSDYSDNVRFHQTTFKEYSPESTGHDGNCEAFDAIVAATSLHWALGGDDDRGALISKLHSLLNPNGGALLLFWNFPPEPHGTDLDRVADALGKPKPFYFGKHGPSLHGERLREIVLAPIEDSGLFTAFVDHSCPSIEEEIPISSYVNLLRTLSNYIAMEDKERELFLATVTKTLGGDGTTDVVRTSRESRLNISYPVL